MSTTEETLTTSNQHAELYVPAIESHLVQSKYVAQAFKIQVMQPAMNRGETTRFAVIYVTDGNFAFDVLKGLAYSMQIAGRDVPRFIVVGIGYPGDSPLAGTVLRARDLTFSKYPKLSTKPPNVHGVLTAQEGTKDFHGAEEFQEFIARELIPFVDARYATLPGERTYYGHSAGAGFGLFTAFNRPELFKNYILSSPGLIYHGESSAGAHYENYDFLLQEVRRFVAAGRSLDGVKIYMSVGEEEEFEPTLMQWQLTSSFYKMVALLRRSAISGLELTAEVFPGETHMTVWPMSFIHGVQSIFGAGAGGRRSMQAG